MSEKKAKELRKKVAVSINILAMEDGNMQITGIPQNPYMAMDIMGTAIKVMAGRLHAIANESNIIQPKPSIFGMDGKRLT